MHKSITGSLLILGLAFGTQFASPSTAGHYAGRPARSTVVVKVKPGDTLWGLAKRYRTTVNALAQCNGIRNPNLLYAGRTIKVPAHSRVRRVRSAAFKPVVSRSRDRRAVANWLETKSGLNELSAPVLSGRLSSGYGYRRGRMHWGVDLACPHGTPVHAVSSGEVRFAGWIAGYGLTVVIDHGGFRSRYAHNSRVHVSVGQRVCSGQTIAAVGHTGRATGNHLHLEIEHNGRRIDPLPFFDCY
jgi:LysM repeat protein